MGDGEETRPSVSKDGVKVKTNQYLSDFRVIPGKVES